MNTTESIIAVDIPSAISTWKKHDNTEYYHYNAMTGLFIILVDEGGKRCVMTRNDSGCAAICRQYHRELEAFAPDNERLYGELTTGEFADVWIKVIDGVNNAMRELLQGMKH